MQPVAPLTCVQVMSTLLQIFTLVAQLTRFKCWTGFESVDSLSNVHTGGSVDKHMRAVYISQVVFTTVPIAPCLKLVPSPCWCENSLSEKFDQHDAPSFLSLVSCELQYVQIIEADASPSAVSPPAGNPDREGGESLKAVNSGRKISLRCFESLQADSEPGFHVGRISEGQFEYPQLNG